VAQPPATTVGTADTGVDEPPDASAQTAITLAVIVGSGALEGGHRLSAGTASATPALALVDTHHEYTRAFEIYVPIAIGVFALIFVLVIFSVVRFGRRPPERAARWHEHNPLEVGYAVVLVCVVAFLLYVTFSAEHRVDTVSAREAPSVTINVTAAKWEWTFQYPAYGITENSGTVGRQVAVVPVNAPVRFNLTSPDVIHAFWIPGIDYKHDAIPGSTQRVTLAFPHVGLFPGQCAEFCGLRHSDMVFAIRAVSSRQFAAWAASGGRSDGS
jgi:cytochrome c oxidase subunit 2